MFYDVYLLVYKWSVEDLEAEKTFAGDALVPLWLGFPCFHRILNGCVRCFPCAKDLKASSHSGQPS